MAILRFLLGALAVTALGAQFASADLVEDFSTSSPSGGVTAGVFSLTKTSLEVDGVTFDATLTVTGTGSDVNRNGNGLGVGGGGSPGMTDLGVGEFLTFTMSVTNVSSGTVNFDGFTTVNFHEFDSGDSAVFSEDNSIGGVDDFLVFTPVGATPSVSISTPLPTEFSVLPSAGEFRVTGVGGSFSLAAVPEPTAFLFGSLVAGSVGMVVARRRPARKA